MSIDSTTAGNFCGVCGHKFSIWERVKRHDPSLPCDECRGTGEGLLQDLMQTILGAPPQGGRVRDWIKRFDELSAKYHIAPNGAAFAAATVAWIRQSKASSDDLALAVELVSRFGAASLTPQLALSLAAHCAMARWDLGQPPVVACSGLILLAGEICRWQESARLLERRTRTSYAGISQGISVPLGYGFRYRVGAFKGAPIQTSVLTDAGGGTIHITNQRFCFTGVERSLAVPFSKLISVSYFADAIQLFRSNAKGAIILQVADPLSTLNVLSLAMPRRTDAPAISST